MFMTATTCATATKLSTCGRSWAAVGLSSVSMRAVLLLAASAACAQTVDTQFFESKIRPVLVEKCYACHSSKLKAPMAGLVIDSKAGLLRGGRLGAGLVPGKPEE